MGSINIVSQDISGTIITKIPHVFFFTALIRSNDIVEGKDKKIMGRVFFFINFFPSFSSLPGN